MSVKGRIHTPKTVRAHFRNNDNDNVFFDIDLRMNFRIFSNTAVFLMLQVVRVYFGLHFKEVV